MLVRIVSRTLFCVGLVLFGINIAGLFTSLRNRDIYTHEYGYFKNRVTLTEDQLWAATVRTQNESAKEYVLRLNAAVHNGIAHYWEDDGIYKYNLRIPVQENYLLFLGSYFYPAQYAKYEYCDYTRAIKRGVGLCSQQAIIVAGLLSNQGINSRIAELGGHVVSMAEVENGVWWVLDPDYGVVIPHDLTQIENDPAIIKPVYKEKGYSEAVAEYLAGIYSRSGNRIYGGVSEYRSRKITQIERLSYILIWIIPVVMITPFIVTGLFPKLSGSHHPVRITSTTPG